MTKDELRHSMIEVLEAMVKAEETKIAARKQREQEVKPSFSVPLPLRLLVWPFI